MTLSLSSPRVVAIVQARLGSSRLPLKSLLSLRGATLVDWVARRLNRARELDHFLFAIPDTELDCVLAEHLERNGIAWSKGSENDVLDRFVRAARLAQADIVVRVCADNPLISPEAVDRLVRFFKNSQADYAYNHIPRANLWPDGLGAEIVSMQTLEKIWNSANTPAQREHCFNLVWDNPGDWKIATFNPEEKWLQRPDLKLDIDSKDDFQKLARLHINPEMDLKELILACGGKLPA